MPRQPTDNPKQFIQGAPVLHVPDVTRVAAYFRDVLGFTWDFGDEQYAVIWRDNSAVHLLRAPVAASGVHLFQWVRDVDAYHAEIAARGAVIAAPPQNTPYGLREFNVELPGGTRVVFSQEID